MKKYMILGTLILFALASSYLMIVTAATTTDKHATASSYFMTVTTDKQVYNPTDKVYVSGTDNVAKISTITVESNWGPAYAHNSCIGDSCTYSTSITIPSTAVAGAYKICAYALEYGHQHPVPIIYAYACTTILVT